jgi:hypothetical protein
MTKIAGSGSASGSGSISPRHGSADPDPHQNVMDPQHCMIYYCTLTLVNDKDNRYYNKMIRHDQKNSESDRIRIQTN